MSDISYSELTREEIKQLTDTLIKSKLIDKYNKDKLMETRFDRNTINKLINRPMKIQVDAENDKAYVIVLSESGNKERKYLDDFETDGVETTADFISDHLPDFTFPVLALNPENIFLIFITRDLNQILTSKNRSKEKYEKYS